MVTRQEAAIIKGMLARGDKQQWIVAWFGGVLNPGRIADIHTGATCADVKAAPPASLPPRGPYISGRQAHEAWLILKTAKSALDQAILSLCAQDNVVTLHQTTWDKARAKRRRKG